MQVFSYDPRRDHLPPPSNATSAIPGAPLTDVAGDGRLEFESADDRFAYAFTSFAYSGLPVQLWRFQGGRFVDVTRAFPKALGADAAHQWGRFVANRRQGLGLGFIAAWAADEYLLRRRGLAPSDGWRREARLGRLRSGDHLSPGGAGFVGQPAALPGQERLHAPLKTRLPRDASAPALDRRQRPRRLSSIPSRTIR